MIEIDGSQGEGGGQVLRTSLALSLCTGGPFRIVGIRSKRAKPGLRPQHLAAVRAAAEIAAAELSPIDVGTTELTFHPRGVRGGGDFDFDVGTAGSTTLVLQTVLPALWLEDTPSTVHVVGGTHNPLAPPFEFLARSWLPLCRRLGADVDVELVRHGFAPAGGGAVRARVRPTAGLAPFDLLERGRLRAVRARACVARLPRHVAERELEVVRKKLGERRPDLSIETVDSDGPGNALTIEIESEHVTEVLTGFGAPGLPAERVANRVVRAVRRYLDSGVPVGPNLADQLLIPMALAGGGAFRSVAPSAHATTNAAVVERFLPVTISTRSDGDSVVIAIEEENADRDRNAG